MKALLFPGQGAQFTGMGEGLFERFATEVQQADSLLGCSSKALCIDDPDNLLCRFEYAQPALYLVNALHFLSFKQEIEISHSMIAGHGIGEFNALFAAGICDFYTGLALAKRRAELATEVHQAKAGVLVNCEYDDIHELLESEGLTDVSISQYNAPRQFVIVAPAGQFNALPSLFKSIKGRLFPLNNQPAIHSIFMQRVAAQFADYAGHFRYLPADIPVISGYTGTSVPTERNEILDYMALSMTKPLSWLQVMQAMRAKQITLIDEVGPGDTLQVWWSKFKEAGAVEAQSIAQELVVSQPETALDGQPTLVNLPLKCKLTGKSIGSDQFKTDYETEYAYIGGGLYRGISSVDYVVRMAKAGLLSFLGAGGLSLKDIDDALLKISEQLTHKQVFGVTVLSDFGDQQHEMALIELLLSHEVNVLETVAFLDVSPALVLFCLRGLSRDSEGNICAKNKIIARVFRPEIAETFLKPAPERMVNLLLEQKKITPEQAQLAKSVPIAHDLCVDANVGGISDRNSLLTLLPQVVATRDKMRLEYGYKRVVRVGAVGSFGAPDSVVAAIMIGAEFIETNSINQCSVEAETSASVKEMLSKVQTHDIDYAPFSDLFELGGKVQVVRKGSFFSSRAQRLFELWQRFNSLNELDAGLIYQLENNYFRKSLDDVWRDVYAHYQENNPQEIIKANRNKKHRMALIFRWYLTQSFDFARLGNEARRVDFQVHCSPAMGAFNAWVKGTELEPWQNRHVDVIGKKLMDSSAEILQQRIIKICGG